MKLLSIIIPAYNCEKHIERCLDSLINQTYKELEIIVIDDGSSDNTYLLCEKYLNDQRIKLFQTDNFGVSHARNIGIKNATGQYIVFVDSDDYVENDLCEILINLMKTSDVELGVCGYKTYNGEEFNIISPENGEYNLNKFLDKYITTEFINVPWAKIYKKDNIKELFNEERDMGEDFEFNITYLVNCKRIAFSKEPSYIYNLANENSLTRNIEKMGEEIYTDISVLQNYFCDENELIKKFTSRRLKNYLSMAKNSAKNFPEYEELLNIVRNNEELKKTIKKLKIKDFRIKLMFGKNINLLWIAETIIQNIKN